MNQKILTSTSDLVASRLADYRRTDATKMREELVSMWRQHHPEAAKEQSVFLRPLMRDPDHVKHDRSDPDEFWWNDVYQVTVRRHASDPVFGSRGGMVQLGISTLEGTARHDWREFQAIKNQIAGPECEGFELYPAESRLLDPSNYYTLWCFPGLKRIRVGVDERRVFDADAAMAPQRAFPARDEATAREEGIVHDRAVPQ